MRNIAYSPRPGWGGRLWRMPRAWSNRLVLVAVLLSCVLVTIFLVNRWRDLVLGYHVNRLIDAREVVSVSDGDMSQSSIEVLDSAKLYSRDVGNITTFYSVTDDVGTDWLIRVDWVNGSYKYATIAEVSLPQVIFGKSPGVARDYLQSPVSGLPPCWQSDSSSHKDRTEPMYCQLHLHELTVTSTGEIRIGSASDSFQFENWKPSVPPKQSTVP